MAFNYRNPQREYYQHDSRRGGPSRGQGRPRYQNNRKAGGGRGYLRGNYVHVDGDGDICMGGEEEPKAGGRFAPYAKPGYRQAKGGVRRGRGRLGNDGDHGTGSRSSHGSQHYEVRFPNEKSWNKVLIPYGRRCEKKFILEALTQDCPLPFVPVNYHTDGNAAVFYLEDHEAAAALLELHQKITMPDGKKMSIVVRPSGAPLGFIPRESVEQVKACISRRYNPALGTLDLSYFHQDGTLKAEGHFLPLYRQTVAFSVVETIEQNIHNLLAINLSGNKLRSLSVFASVINNQRQLKNLFLSENMLPMIELERLKNLPIEELALNKTPVLKDFSSRSDLITALRKIFPKLLRLDGEVLPPLILFDLDGTASIPESLGHFFVNDQAQSVAFQFIELYFTMYDSENRKALIDAYHDAAMFALSVHKPNSGAPLLDYTRTGRNLLRVPEADRRLRYLYRGKLDIVACLQRLPLTQHDAGSLTMDVSLATASIMTITVCGIFREVASKFSGDVRRAFSRTFVLVPHGSGFNIISETFIVTNLTAEQSRKAFKTPTSSSIMLSQVESLSLNTQSATPVHQVTLKEQMVDSFSQQSGMNRDWAVKCLEDNNWDFDKAAQVFSEMNAVGRIPKQAFVH